MIDLAIIGGGPGGYVAAERAGAKGLNVVLFEKRELGGVCLNEGCIPTKTLLYSAKIYDYAKHGDKYGVLAAHATYDYGKIVDRKNKVVRKLVGGVGAKMKAHNVKVVKGEAKIKGRSETQSFRLPATFDRLVFVASKSFNKFLAACSLFFSNKRYAINLSRSSSACFIKTIL